MDNAALYTARAISDIVEIWTVRHEDLEKAMLSDFTLAYKFYTYFTSLMVKWTVQRKKKGLKEAELKYPDTATPSVKNEMSSIPEVSHTSEFS